MGCRVPIIQFFKNRKEWPVKRALCLRPLLGYFICNICPLILPFIEMYFQSCKQRYPKKGDLLHFYKAECNFCLKITFCMLAEKVI